MEQHTLPESVQKVASQNISDVLQEGAGLRYDMGIFVVVKDTKNGRAKLGGLGGMGVGQMWVDIYDHVRTFSGYEEAPDIDSDTHNGYLNYFTGEVEVWERPNGEPFSIW